ncbi:hypothetical protein KUF71_009442, partial [Frankliniella fusca]
FTKEIQCQRLLVSCGVSTQRIPTHSWNFLFRRDVKNLENASDEEIENVIDYFSNLIRLIRLETVQNSQEDLAQLLQKVQRHTKCSPDYCIRRNKTTKVKQCTYLGKKKPSGELEFKPERNDPLLNKFNAFIIQLWRANIDIAPVISERALLAYLAKYISKCEVQPKALDEIFSKIVEGMAQDSKAKTAIQKMFIKSCSDRDISAQEVCHTLLSLPFCSSGGRKFIIVNTSPKKWQTLNNEEFDEENTSKGKNFLEKYRERPDYLNDLSLWNAAKFYNLPKWSSVKPGKENIVRIFPRYTNFKDDTEVSEQYYKQQVVLHIGLPWRYEEDLNPDSQPWKTVYEYFKVNEKTCEMYKLNNVNENSDDEFESDDDASNADSEEEFMVLSRLGPKSDVPEIQLGTRQVDLDYNWTDSYLKYEHLGTPQEMQSFLDRMKGIDSTDNNNNNSFDEQIPQLNFSPDQQEIIGIVKEHIVNLKSGNNYSANVAKTILIQSKAETGKSYVIKYLTSVLKNDLGPDSYLIATPTGVSAILINAKNTAFCV